MDMKTNFSRLGEITKESVHEVLDEGIDVDDDNLTVSYNPSNEEHLETLVITDRSLTKDKYVPSVVVWSIFQCKNGCKGDVNSLVYALKNEKGWRFKTIEDKNAILNQIHLIADKFFKTHNYPVTIVLPFNGPLNVYVLEIAKQYNKDIKVIDDLMIYLSVEEVREMLIAPNSLFRETFQSERDFYRALNDFDRYTSKMIDEVFRTHLVENNKLRKTIEQTFQIQESIVYNYMSAINNNDILILDDNVGFGSSIKNLYNEIRAYYSPKSITVLTLFSEKYT